ncbi:Gfo/Idh/MocA family protein [Chitinasiproducens palmae]|uniref:Predicted dehydrogenase n=1 Tax=Chitinasiproducens palmae TaxID=1770053 RepID=A0A1H2PIZ4_9BURK|nr:Gfo/Idh/MocA family oxidoreductase [Chitinasiproducens palmae]SDV46246.1 Predicted dehydrogenase [Chitinasiproducens palmae]
MQTDWNSAEDTATRRSGGTDTSRATARHGDAQPAPGGARRNFLRAAGAGLAASIASGSALAAGTAETERNRVGFTPIDDPKTEAPKSMPDPNAAPDDRIGYAVVGLGRLAVGEILPALAECKFSKIAALVSGDRDKALKLARQYGVKTESVYDYASYDRLASNPDVKVIYIVLPNSMHADFTVRGARAGKHILCEKPMATSVADCERMIAACRSANVKLMIAYRSQYEPMDRAIAKMVRDGALGPLREFVAGNSQNTVDPQHWRHKKALAGGGALPDIGLYCLNAARFMSGAEPEEVFATTSRVPNDPRYAEVEAGVHFILRFPGGFTATCVSNYASHDSRFLRLQGPNGWVELNPAFAYNGLKLRHSRLQDKHNTVTDIEFPPANQFALEIDHMSLCVMQDRTPHTPGEEGLQDQRIMEAIYRSAETGRAVRLSPPPGPTRGPEPDEQTF